MMCFDAYWQVLFCLNPDDNYLTMIMNCCYLFKHAGRWCAVYVSSVADALNIFYGLSSCCFTKGVYHTLGISLNSTINIDLHFANFKS